MTDRERWNRTMHFKSVDRIPNEEFGYWGETLDRWHKEGLPDYVDSNYEADLFFKFDIRKQLTPSGSSSCSI
jgi:hypothetical protein